MTWLAWRQLRIPAAATAALVALLIFAVALVHAGHTPADAESARQLIGGLRALAKRVVVFGDVLVLLLPAAIGAFWGAPLLARELEAGTHRLAWAQSVTRTRWLLTKLALTAAAAVVVAGTASLALSRWVAPIDAAVAKTGDQGGLYLARVAPVVFPARGIVPIGLALFALMLGVVAGLLVRRTLPAMAITLVVFLMVSLAVPQWIRPHLVAPVTVAQRMGGEGAAGTFLQFQPRRPPRVVMTMPGTWILSQRTVDRTGKATSLPSSFQNCARPEAAGPPSLKPCFDALYRAGYRQRFVYQPASHFWPLQLVETALYVALALALGAVALWRIRFI